MLARLLAICDFVMAANLDPIANLMLVLGGARSGKSLYAQAAAEAAGAARIYIATAEALDEEMKARIAVHRTDRGPNWTTIEAPIALAAAIDQAPADAPVVIDCLTLWLTNLMLGDHDIDAATEALMRALEARKARTIAVANEVGLGIVPETPLGRAFRDRAGILNRRIAAAAREVVLMVAGLPLKLK